VGTAVALSLMIVGALLWRGRQLAEPMREIKQQQITVNPTENPVLASSMSPDGSIWPMATQMGCTSSCWKAEKYVISRSLRACGAPTCTGDSVLGAPIARES